MRGREVVQQALNAKQPPVDLPSQLDGPASTDDSYPDGAGRNSTQHCFGIYLCWPGTNGSVRTRGIAYNWIDDDICYENAGEREVIVFGYSNREKQWKVTITGRNLGPLYDKLMDGKRLSIRVSRDASAHPFVEAIIVEDVTPEKD